MYAANRRLFIKLANELLMIEDYERAKEVLDYSCKVIPHHHLKYDYQNAAFNMAEYYFRLKDQEKGEEIITSLANKSIEYINWYIGMNNFGWSRVADDCRSHLYLLSEIVKLMEENSVNYREFYIEQLNELYYKYSLRVN